MTVLSTAPTFFARRLSSYVPAMQYAADVNIIGDPRFSFGLPTAANATFLVSAQSVSAAGSLQASGMLNSATLDAVYGRALVAVLSGAGSGTLIIDGWDYLAQPTSENLALNGTTPVNGKKAFKWIRQITWPTVGAVTLNLGTQNLLGLPYKAGRVFTEEANGAVVATLGTLTSPDLTVPATATTGDPRGTYTPQTTPNGTTTITASFMCYADVDANNNGGLHGVPQYSN